MKRKLFTTCIIAALLVTGLLVSPTRAQDKLDQIKCAFLLNFTKYVTWPDGKGDFIIGVVGKDPFDGVLDKVIDGKTAGDRPIKTAYLAADASADDLKKCSIVYVTTDLAPVLAKLGSASVLTVGDQENFAKNKGMIGLVATTKISLEINNKQAEAAKLKINAKLLQMSTIVE